MDDKAIIELLFSRAEGAIQALAERFGRTDNLPLFVGVVNEP